MRGARRWRIVALLAVGIAIGVVMTATPATGHVAGWTHNWTKHIKPKTDARYYTKAQANARFVNESELLWAVVDADGTLARGNRVASVTKLGGGTYEVLFTRNVRACAYVGSIGNSDDVSIPPSGEFSAVGRFGEPNGLYIRTMSSAGASTDLGFHVAAFCAGAPAALAVTARPPTSGAVQTQD